MCLPTVLRVSDSIYRLPDGLLAGFAFTPMQLALARGLRTFAYLNLSVVHVRQRLVEVAHVEPFPAARTFHEMIGLGFGNAVRIEAAIIPGSRD
jgi:hypothetical protein